MTGFVAAEKNAAAGFLTARNADGHAWAEAYDPARGWILVEATADAGVPQPRPAGVGSTLWDAVNDVLFQIREGYRRGGLAWLVWAGLSAAVTPAGALLVLAVAAYLVVRSYQTWAAAGPRVGDPLVERLERARVRAERWLARRDVVRRPSEPPTRFARRLLTDYRATRWADWYVAYATARYDPQRDAGDVESLEASLRELLTSRQLESAAS